MATISKTGIEPGKIIRSEHILRVINALAASSSADIIVSGSISGSYIRGDGRGLTNLTASAFSSSLVQTEPWHVPYLDGTSQVWANSPIHVTASLVNDETFFYVSINTTGTFQAESRAPSSLNIYQNDPDAYTIIDSFGNTDNYLQLNVKNFNTGGFASGDVVVTADNGSESDMYVDLGINNSGYSVEGGVGRAGDAYLYSLANEFYIGNAREGATGSLNFFVGGFDIQDRVKLKISSSGDLILSGALEVTGSGHRVYGSIQFFGDVTASNIPQIDADPYHIPYLDETFTLVNSAIHQTASLVDGTNWYYIGINTFAAHDSEAPEALIVEQLNTSSFNVITSVGDSNSYLQDLICNHNSGSLASSDLVAGNDTATEEGNYVNLGINSSNYDSASGIVGGPNDGYLYTTGSNLLIGNATADKAVVIFNGGYDVEANAKVYIHPSGVVGINTSTTSSAVSSEVPALRVLPANNSSYNIIQAESNVATYSQINIQNLSDSVVASSDIVATNDIGTETEYYIDMGINSSNYNVINAVGGESDAYIYSTGKHLHIGNATANEPIMFFAGGFNADTNQKLILYPNNRHEMTGSLHLSGSLYLPSGSSVYVGDNKQFNYGAFSDLQSQSGSANTSGSFQYSNTDRSSGVVVENNNLGLPTRLKVSYTGTYNLQFSVQISQGASSADVYIWFKKNGQNIANSATILTVPSNQKSVAAWNFVDTLNADDYLEIAYESTSSNTTYPYIAASGNIPGVPSIIATLTQIS